MESHVLIHQNTSSSLFLLYTAGIVLLLALISYWFAAKWNKENTSRLKKEQKAALKQKTKKTRLAGHLLLTVSIMVAIVHFGKDLTKTYHVDSLNFNVEINVTDDPDYGAEHSDDPVQYEMKIPTSGTHSPHDLKFGFYEEKPANEMLVHNLEHGDIIIYYRKDADSVVASELEYLAKFREAGAGVLAVPSEDIPEGKANVVTAWMKTMELPEYDGEKIGQYIYEHINKGPEQIPASIRRGGGTM